MLFWIFIIKLDQNQKQIRRKNDTYESTNAPYDALYALSIKINTENRTQNINF